MSNIIEYLIKAKDLTKGAINSAINGVKRFNASVAVATTNVAHMVKKALPALSAVGGAFGMMEGAVGKAARAITGVATAALAFGPLGAAISAVQVAFSLFAAKAEEEVQALQERVSKMAASLAKRSAEIKQDIIDGLAGGLETATSVADKLIQRFDILAQKRAGLQKSVADLFSAQSGSKLLGMERQASEAIFNADDDKKGIVTAEWRLKIAKEKERITKQEAEYAAAMEAQAIKDDERRLALAERAEARYRAQAEKAQERYERTKEIYDANPATRDKAFLNQIETQVKAANAKADAEERRADGIRAKLEVARANVNVGDEKRAGQLASASNSVLNAEHELAEAQRDYEKNRALQAEQEAREQELLIEKQEAERMASEKRIHDEKLRLAKEELSEIQRQSAEAEGRLSAAQAKVSKAWGWYRDKNSMQAAIDDYKGQKAAEVQWEKDFDRLKSKHPDWRKAEFGTLSAEDEATRQVALAKEEENAAQKALDELVVQETEANENIAAILTALTGEGE